MGTRSLCRESHGRAFFVYDHKKHGEEDDPKDAILFFYPTSVDVGEQIALVGGLIGTMDFCMEVLQDTPSLISLTSCKFALLKTGSFILGLSSELHVPEQCVTQHLQYLWNIFCLFQGSLQAVKQRTGEDGFTQELTRIWTSYFSLCLSFSDQLSQAFGIIPYRELPLSQSDIFLEASHILQRAQHQAGVIGGMLLNRNRVLCTQLSSDVTRRFLVLMPHERNFPCIEIKPAFDLPGGVRLLCAFMTPEELASLGPRKRDSSRSRNAQGQKTESDPSPSSPPVSEVPPHPQQTHGTKLASGLSAVPESAEVQEVDVGSEEDQDSDQSWLVFHSLDAEPSLSVAAEDHRSEAPDAGVDVEESQSKLMGVHCSDSGATDHHLQHDLSAGIAPSSELSEKVEAKPENHKGGSQVEIASERTELIESVLSKKEGVISGHKKTDVLDKKASENSPKDVEILNEAFNDSDTVNNKDRHSGDGSSAEDGGAEKAQRVTHTSGIKNATRDVPSSVKNSPVGVCSTEKDPETRGTNSLNTPLLEISLALSDPGNRDTADCASNSVITPAGNPLETSCPEGCGEQDTVDGEGRGAAASTTCREQSDGGASFSAGAGEERDADRGEADLQSPLLQSHGAAVVSSPCTDHDENLHFVAAVSVTGSSHLAADGENSGLSPDDFASPQNSAVVSPDTTTLCSDSTAVFTDPTAVSTDPTAVSTDPTAVSTDSTAVSPDSVAVSPDSTAVSPDSVAVSPDSTAVSPDPTAVSPDSTAVSSDKTAISLASAVHQRNTLSLHNTTSTFSSDNSVVLSQSLPSPPAQVVHFGSAPRVIEPQAQGADPQSVPVEVELQLDLVHNGASSVLTVSDDLLSPNKERLSFQAALLNSESSGSSGGGGGGGGGGSSAWNPAASQPHRLKKYSAEPSSSDLAHSTENSSTFSSTPSSTLLSSPSTGATGPGQGPDMGLEGRKQVLLYLQGHMDTLLVLLLEDLSHATKETVNILWQSSLTKLAELDFAVSDANEMGVDEATGGPSSYLYLKYNSTSRAMEGTAKSPVTSLANELVSSSILLHDTFTRLPATQDMLCRTHTTSCYGHRTLCSETFFQVATSKSSGFPNPHDITFSLDQSADRKLYADHRTALL